MNQIIIIVPIQKGRAIFSFPSVLSEDIERSVLTVFSIYSREKLNEPVFFHTSASICPAEGTDRTYNNICGIGYFLKDNFFTPYKPINLLINNVNSVNITANTADGRLLESFNGHMCLQIKGYKKETV